VTAPVRTVTVALGDRAYPIHVGTGLIARAGDLLGSVVAGRRAVVVTDATVAALHLGPLEAALRAGGARLLDPVVVPPGEASKDLATLDRVLDALLAQGIDRRTLVVALGGGVIGDLAGFAASVALRGLEFVQVPTTLLAQVDSSVGGKTGVNTRHGKNLVGAFHQPVAVLADTGVLDTLPRREVRAGYAEVAKYGLLGDAAFFGWLETAGASVVEGDAEARARAIAVSCAAKAAIVARDERETGDRALLNLGHTFGHALEAAAGFDGRLLHGEAVAIGMVQAFRLSARLGHAPAADGDRAAAHLAAMGLPVRPADRGLAFPAETLLAAMRKDKKASDGRLTFVLVRGVGEAFVARDVPEGVVAEVLAATA
jgi:3-dehydroquinate synthase